MHAILLVSHGSRREQSNHEVIQLCCQLNQYLEEHFDMVSAAFLEIASPSIPDGIKDCVSRGASTITVLPYFLSAGRHVAEDIPSIIHNARGDYPHIEFLMTPHVGAFTKMPHLLSTAAKCYSQKI